MDAVTRQRLNFEDFVLDPMRRRLSAGDREIKLRPKSFDVLCYLAERHGRLATKDEIIQAVWPNVVATDDSLARCVSDVRQALGDSDQRIVKTVPGRGYMFAAPVSPPAAESLAPAAVPPEVDGATKTALRRRTVMLGVALLAGATLAVAPIVVPWRQPAPPQPTDRPSVAVLPFENLSGDAGQDYLSDGITEDLTVGLTKFSGLAVIAVNSAFRYKDSGASNAQIGRELGARYLLLGSLREDTERLRITVRLVVADDGAQIWAERYDREPEGVFAVLDDVTEQIVVRLVARINRSELDRAMRRPPKDWAAHDHYLRGNAYMKDAPRDASGGVIVAARQAYEQALTVDPRYAPAMQGLALTYWTAWLKPDTDEPIRGEFAQPAALDRAQALAERAIELDPALAEAYATLGWILHWQRGPSAGLKVFERAFEFNPNLVDRRFALLLAHAGRAPEAIDFMQRAMRLDPFHTLRDTYYLGSSYFFVGRDPEALELLREVARGIPRLPPALPMFAAVAALAAHDDEARVAAAEVRKLRPDFTITKFLHFMRLERPEDAARVAEGLRRAGLPE